MRAVLLAVAAVLAAEAAMAYSSAPLAFAPQAGLALKGRSLHASRLTLRSSRPATASLSMMASPLNARHRVKKVMEKCKDTAKGVAAASVAAVCVTAVSPPRAVFAATAAPPAPTTEQTSTPQAKPSDVDPDSEEALHMEMEEPEEEEIEFTGRRKLTVAENLAKYGVLGGGLGGWLIYTVLEGKKADREEEERVTAEVERIEQWKKEFIDMEDVVSDDDIMDSLSKRLSGETADDVDLGADGSGGLPRGFKPDDDGDDDGGAAAEADTLPAADSEKMDRLRRMMGGEEGDSKK